MPGGLCSILACGGQDRVPSRGSEDRPSICFRMGQCLQRCGCWNRRPHQQLCQCNKVHHPSGALWFGFVALLLLGLDANGSAGKTTGKASAEKVSRGTTWCSAQFFKVCFLIFATGLAREAQKFLIPLVAAEQGISATIVGQVAFVSQMESMVAAPVGGFLMEALGVVPVVFVSLLLSAMGIQCLCVNGLAFYVHGASLLGLGCGLSAGSAIALSILHAPEGVEGQRRAFMNGCRFCNSLADLLLPVAFGSLSSAFSVLVAGSSLTVSTLVAVCIGLFLFPLKLMSEGFASTKVPSMDFVVSVEGGRCLHTDRAGGHQSALRTKEDSHYLHGGHTRDHETGHG